MYVKNVQMITFNRQMFDQSRVRIFSFFDTDAESKWTKLNSDSILFNLFCVRRHIAAWLLYCGSSSDVYDIFINKRKAVIDTLTTDWRIDGEAESEHQQMKKKGLLPKNVSLTFESHEGCSQKPHTVFYSKVATNLSTSFIELIFYFPSITYF